MKKILYVFIGAVFSLGIVSCGQLYDITNLQSMEFKKPAGWQQMEQQDSDVYDYIFLAQDGRARFEVYLRVLYVPRKNTVQWLKDERRELKNKGCAVKEILKPLIKGMDWHMLESEDTVSSGSGGTQINIRQYAAKEKRSPRLFQCFVIGEKKDFHLLNESDVNVFLESIHMSEAGIAAAAEQAGDYYKSYFVSSQERDFVLRGKKLLGEGDYERAITVFQSVLERKPSAKLEVELYCLLSECYLAKGIPEYVDKNESGSFRQAIKYAEKSFSLRKRYWQPYLNAGIAYMDMREFEPARQYLEKALKYCGKNSSEYANLLFYVSIAKNSGDYKRVVLPVFPDSHKIDGIMYDARAPVVIIGGKSYQLRDEVSGYRVMKITADKLYLKSGYWVDEFSSGNVIPRLPKPLQDVSPGK